ncbi:uncharacterized protein LOC129752259 [Uranotaenia lowii]|uniref:uncharacterized protein LOC129752259 n=1 Tax=Uranotaenia lowii TaxID=190385 RepID=UPI002478C44F|nr:uncharacterized protein LOC129752259 [Uranotaenia lowii]
MRSSWHHCRHHQHQQPQQIFIPRFSIELPDTVPAATSPDRRTAIGNCFQEKQEIEQQQCTNSKTRIRWRRREKVMLREAILTFGSGATPTFGHGTDTDGMYERPPPKHERGIGTRK